jgi:hypothetical protein
MYCFILMLPVFFWDTCKIPVVYHDNHMLMKIYPIAIRFEHKII